MGFDHRDDEDARNNNNKFYSFNSKIMMAAIVSLIVVVILIIVLHIYGRCVLRRRARRRRAMTIHRLTVTVAAQAHSADQPKKGLDPAVISSFPTFPFKKNNNSNNNEDEEHHHQSDVVASIECAVCLSILEEGEMVRVLPNCKHTFHTDCIDTWLISHTNCPICRTEAEPRVQTVATEGIAPATVEPTAPPVGSSCREGSSDCGLLLQSKPEVSSSRLSSFRRMLTGERSSRRIQPSGADENTTRDIERQ